MTACDFRVGIGFDVHRYHAGRPLVLCGIELPNETGLEGHSDADVVLHAVTDAVLGAVGAGDIGQHFPPTDARFKDASSGRFLAHALDLAAQRGFGPANCDVTLIGERPRLTPHRETLSVALAELMRLDLERVNLKATTTEGLGWTGRGEGLACTAAVLMCRLT